MASTFLKRQKEMKRLEKQREKAERRVQKKVAKLEGGELSSDEVDNMEVLDGPLINHELFPIDFGDPEVS